MVWAAICDIVIFEDCAELAPLFNLGIMGDLALEA